VSPEDATVAAQQAPEARSAAGAGAPDLKWCSAGELARLVADGTVSAREVVDVHIDRIEAVDVRLNAVIARRFDEARAEASAVDAARARGEALGPLAGVPITIKEQFDVEGLATTFGLPTRADAKVPADGPLVKRLRAAGAIPLGKTNVAELLFYQEGDNPLFGRTSNPWDLERTSGGGSGGEGAIIAAGGSPLGLAADIGGSIRTPAHFCGIQGLRPTSGRLTNLDSPPELFFPGMEAVVLDPGPMARTVSDLDLAMRVLGAPGLEKLDPRVSPVPWPDHRDVELEGLRIGVFEEDGYWPASPAMRRAVREAADILTARGAIVESFADPDPEAATRFYFSFLTAGGVGWLRQHLEGNPVDPRIKMLLRISSLPSRLHGPAAALLEAVGQPRLANGFRWSAKRSAQAYWRLAVERADWRRRFLAAMDEKQLDAIVCPPHTVPAMRHGATYYLYDTPSYLMRFNVLGMPAGAVAATRVRPGEESDRPRTVDRVDRTAAKTEKGSAGLPVGVQVAARHWREDVVLAVMTALEAEFSTRPDYPEHPPELT
jgi:fatty acid amide hydrolase